MNDCLKAALGYLGRGWAALAVCPPDHRGVPPFHRTTCQKPGKRPLGPWKQWQARLPRAPPGGVGTRPVSSPLAAGPGVLGPRGQGRQGHRLRRRPRGQPLPALRGGHPVPLRVPPRRLGLRPREVRGHHPGRRPAGPGQAGLLLLSGEQETRDRLAAGAPSGAAGAGPHHRAQRPGQADLGQGAGPPLRLGVLPGRPRRPAPVPGLPRLIASVWRGHSPASPAAFVGRTALQGLFLDSPFRSCP
jgi:hypothetical protein